MILIAYYWQPGLEALTRPFLRSEWYWPGLLFQYYAQGTMALFIAFVAWFLRLQTNDLLGRHPGRCDISAILFVVGITFSASMFIVSLTYIPISYLIPEFIRWWIAWWFQPVVLLASDGSIPIVANVLNFISLVILAPLLEELLFRRYLLHRWSQKWNLWTGVLLSSAIFGMIHPDTLAAAATGIGLALLYLKTRTLWAPIIAHAIYNFIVWAWDLVGVLRNGFDYYTYTIDQFRADWWYGAVGLVVMVLLFDRLMRQRRPFGSLKLPLE